jgi:hypothetical protein
MAEFGSLAESADPAFKYSDTCSKAVGATAGERDPRALMTCQEGHQSVFIKSA